MNDILNKILPKVLDFCTSKYFEKGDYLFQQDEVCQKMFFIKSGICRKYYLNDGKEITTEFLFPENFAISARSFVLQQPSNEFAQAITHVEALILLKSNFEKLKKQNPEILSLDLKFVEMYAIWLEERLFQYHTQDALARYLNLIKNQPEIIKHIPLTYIASYLGVSLETLSRIRSKLANSIT